MKTILAFTILLVILLAACSETEIGVDEPKVDLTISPIVNQSFSTSMDSQSSLKSGGTYNRGTAPVYIAGVDITVSNQTHSNIADIDKEFLFVDYGTIGGDDMVISDVSVGSNTISAESIAENEAIIEDMFYGFWNTGQSVTYDAEWFSNDLKTRSPIYAEYSGSIDAQVDLNTYNQSFTIAMKPRTGRIAFVFYGKRDLEYKAKVFCDEIGFEMEKTFSGMYKGCYFLFNDATITGNQLFQIYFYVKADSSSPYELINIGANALVASETGKNKTYLYTYGADIIGTESVSLDFNWTDITDENTDTNIVE